MVPLESLMLVELETALVELIAKSPLKNRLAEVDSLPDLDGDSLVNKFLTSAPAVYVALGSFPISGQQTRPKFGIACVAKNSRGHKAARHGDGVAIGLYQMVDAVIALVNGCTVNAGGSAISFEATGCDQVGSEKLFEKGLYAAVVHIQTSGEIDLPEAIDESQLADFKTFHADYDIDNRQSAVEHNKWLQEPPDHATSAPDLSDNLSLEQPE